MNTTAAELATLTAEPNGYAFSSLNQNLNPATPAGVIVNQANLSVNPGQTIVLAGNQVINTGTIQSPNGTIIITATADGKYVNVSQSGNILSLDLPVAVNQNIAVQNLRPVLPNDIPQLLTGTAYVSGTVSTASTVKNPDSLINITGERVVLDRANLDNLGTYGLIQIRVAPGIANEGYVFLDRVRNYEQLVNSLAPGSELYLINRTDSGVEKVNQVVAKNGAVQRIDIVGDGNAGQIWFGKDFITLDTLPQYETQIAQWGQGLTGNREIYLYACNLAASIVGKELIGEIGRSTNSTVLASTDITGSGQYGGNWQFEYSTGNISGQIAFDAQVVQSADVKLVTFTVTDLGDTGASGQLRDAINKANTTAGLDDIKFALNGTITLNGTALTVTDSAGLTITGNGAANTIIDGNNASRVFNVTAGDITFDGVTIRNGNTAGQNGGGILAFGTVTLTNATVSDNTAINGSGGAIWANNGGTIRNSTIAFNSANNGGGIFRNNGTIDIGNTIVAKNTAGTSPDIGSNVIGTGYTNAGNNLIGDNTGFTAAFTNSVNGTITGVDPLLAPLANNGGAPQTHTLKTGSPALNAGNNALIPMGVTEDQRGAGFDRIVGGTVDIGSYEVGYRLSVNGGTPQSATVNTNFATPLSAKLIDPATGFAVQGVDVTFTTPNTGASGLFGALTTTTATTDSNGIATASTLTANTITGTYTASGSIPSITPISFNLTNNPDVLATLTITGGDNQSTVVNTAFAQPLQVTAQDQVGNAIPNQALTFTAPGIGVSECHHYPRPNYHRHRRESQRTRNCQHQSGELHCQFNQRCHSSRLQFDQQSRSSYTPCASNLCAYRGFIFLQPTQYHFAWH